MIFVPKEKEQPEIEERKKAEITVKPKKEPLSRKPRKPTAIAPVAPLDLWRAFDDIFERFRSDFQDMFFPTSWDRMLSLMPETRVPIVDLEDREKDYLLKAEMPGFKKEDIEIEVQDNSVTVSGRVGWKYDNKAQAYICKERACESFYRTVAFPEEINVDEVTANLSEGLLEITLPKKTPKQKRKVALK